MHRQNTKRLPLGPGKLCLAIAGLSLIVFLFVRIEFLAIIASLLFSLYLLALLFGRAAIKGLRVKIEVSEERSHAGENLKAYLALYNQNRYLPIFYPLIEVIESGRGQIQRFHLPQCLNPKSEIQIPIYPHIQERGKQGLTLRYGLSSFPIRIAEHAIALKSKSAETIIWPRLPRGKNSPGTQPPQNNAQDQSANRDQKDAAAEPSHIRNYQPGDPKRSISWRLSAKLDTLLVAERHAQPNRKYVLVLETRDPGWGNAARYERLLSALSQVTADFLRQRKLHSFALNGRHYALHSQKQYIQFMDALSVSAQHDPAAELEPRKGFHYLFIKPDAYKLFRLVDNKKAAVARR